MSTSYSESQSIMEINEDYIEEQIKSIKEEFYHKNKKIIKQKLSLNKS